MLSIYDENCIISRDNSQIVCKWKMKHTKTFFCACSREIPQILFFLVSFKEVVCFMRSKYLDSNIFMQITMLIDFQHIKCFSVGKILSETCSQAISCCPHWIKLDYSDSIKTSKGKTKLDYFLQFDLVFFILSRFLLEYKRYEKIVKNVITCRTICCY